ncbi:MAG: hypothetical protein MJ101_03560 [Clostridia bacterium]|nr:hypothetical protein [Clostridia bacterium]
MDKIKYYGGAQLAYVGDAVLETFVREKLILRDMPNTGAMSAEAQKHVCAVRQSEKVDLLMPLMTEDEISVYKLGRNYKSSTKPHHATAVEYHRASGFEAVFGYLHLSGNDLRARELFERVYGGDFDKREQDD